MTIAGLAFCGIVVFFVLLFLLWVFATMEPHPLEDFIRDNPEPVPDTPVFPPGDDSPEPDRQDRLAQGGYIEPDWQDDLRAYHSHLCPCPACEARGQSRLHRTIDELTRW